MFRNFLVRNKQIIVTIKIKVGPAGMSTLVQNCWEQPACLINKLTHSIVDQQPVLVDQHPGFGVSTPGFGGSTPGVG